MNLSSSEEIEVKKATFTKYFVRRLNLRNVRLKDKEGRISHSMFHKEEIFSLKSIFVIRYVFVNWRDENMNFKG